MEEWKTKALSAKVSVIIQTDWMDPESSQRLNDLETVAHRQFWDKFKVKDGFDQILQQSLLLLPISPSFPLRLLWTLTISSQGKLK
jgi:hypothetical protein